MKLDDAWKFSAKLDFLVKGMFFKLNCWHKKEMLAFESRSWNFSAVACLSTASALKRSWTSEHLEHRIVSRMELVEKMSAQSTSPHTICFQMQ